LVVDWSAAPAALNDGWLRELWVYVLEKKVVDLYGAMLPMVPVFGSTSGMILLIKSRSLI